MPGRAVSTVLTISWLAVTAYAAVYTNPIIKGNVPDPGVLWVNGSYYVVTTSGWDANAFPIHRSVDLVAWTLVGHVFPNYQANKNPAWAAHDMWAPELHQISATQFNCYFTARHTNGLLSVGVASAPAVTGPYKDIGKPLVQNSSIGCIDATFFRDHTNGQPYLVYKQPTPIFAGQLRADGLAITGPLKDIMTNNQQWEGPLVEGPWVIYNDVYKYYYMFYSGNVYDSTAYAMGVARSTSPLGPWVKQAQNANGNPIVKTGPSGSHWVGPGHCSVVAIGQPTHPLPEQQQQQPQAKTYVIIYHSWEVGHVGGGNPRLMAMDVVQWSADGWPFIHTDKGRGVPSEKQQTIPPA